MRTVLLIVLVGCGEAAVMPFGDRPDARADASGGAAGSSTGGAVGTGGTATGGAGTGGTSTGGIGSGGAGTGGAPFLAPGITCTTNTECASNRCLGRCCKDSCPGHVDCSSCDTSGTCAYRAGQCGQKDPLDPTGYVVCANRAGAYQYNVCTPISGLGTACCCGGVC